MTDANFVSALKVEFEKLGGGGKTALVEVNALKPKVSTLESKVSTLENRPTAPSPSAYVVKAWHSGENGYKKWSDGRLEQWGCVEGTKITITFHVPFSDNKYMIALNEDNISRSGTVVGYAYGYFAYKNTTTLHISNIQSSTSHLRWHVWGY